MLEGIVCLSISIEILSGNIGPSILITIGYTKGFGTTFVTRLLRDCKNTFILTFHTGKLKIKRRRGLNAIGHGCKCL